MLKTFKALNFEFFKSEDFFARLNLKIIAQSFYVVIVQTHQNILYKFAYSSFKEQQFIFIQESNLRGV